MKRPPRKSLQDVKTLAGSLGTRTEAGSPHSIYLKLAMLQLERERRVKEHSLAMASIQRTSKRMQEIEEEVLSLQRQLDGATGVKPEPSRPERGAPSKGEGGGGGAGRVFRF